MGEMKMERFGNSGSGRLHSINMKCSLNHIFLDQTKRELKKKLHYIPFKMSAAYATKLSSVKTEIHILLMT